MQARVMHLSVATADRIGWYYQIDGEEPQGPYSTQIEAGRAARAVILSRAQGPVEPTQERGEL